MRVGYFSLVQYTPVAARREGVNIGVVLIENSGAVGTMFVRDAKPRIYRCFGKLVHQAGHLDAFIASFKTRLSKEVHSVASLSTFAEEQANSITLTPPNRTKFDDFEQELKSLFGELVSDPA